MSYNIYNNKNFPIKGNNYNKNLNDSWFQAISDNNSRNKKEPSNNHQSSIPNNKIDNAASNIGQYVNPQSQIYHTNKRNNKRSTKKIILSYLTVFIFGCIFGFILGTVSCKILSKEDVPRSTENTDSEEVLKSSESYSDNFFSSEKDTQISNSNSTQNESDNQTTKAGMSVNEVTSNPSSTYESSTNTALRDIDDYKAKELQKHLRDFLNGSSNNFDSTNNNNYFKFSKDNTSYTIYYSMNSSIQLENFDFNDDNANANAESNIRLNSQEREYTFEYKRISETLGNQYTIKDDKNNIVGYSYYEKNDASDEEESALNEESNTSSSKNTASNSNGYIFIIELNNEENYYYLKNGDTNLYEIERLNKG